MAKPHINFARVRFNSMGFTIVNQGESIRCETEQENHSPQPRSFDRLLNAV